jgi:hypothetical protein
MEQHNKSTGPDRNRKNHDAVIRNFPHVLSALGKNMLVLCKWLQELDWIPVSHARTFDAVLQEMEETYSHLKKLLASESEGENDTREQSDVVVLPENWLDDHTDPGLFARRPEKKKALKKPGVILPLASLPQKAREGQGTRLYGRPPVVLDDEIKLIMRYLVENDFLVTSEEWGDLLKKLSTMIKCAPSPAIGLEISIIHQGRAKALDIQYRYPHETK